ncbi:MAG: 3-hydroxyacyl-ACP dehydratase FabZ [Alphaproteobacteria bacterium]|jgi:UDP-3-O-[3-hydroxymyristoyl] N-acetylglucosamine deacetylase/3-hydroxyacyl-[acyl-carrier-protein] dehydratase|nr:3-hydroxyacyl-ACP dehydratase FabZ [Alphaproteobacteria bacterium]
MTEKKSSILDINGIKKILPHRYPFLLVDKVIEFKKGEQITALKNVTANEEFFQGHFPNFPIMPGVLVIEALAQTSALYYLLENDIKDNGASVFFMAIDDAKFRKPVVPGDTLHLVVNPVKVRGKICKTRGEAYVDGSLVCEANLTAMLEG